MNEYLLVTRGNFQAWKALSPEESQRIMERYHAFVETLKTTNQFKGGSALKDGSFVFKSKGGKSVMDGPFVETKEAITGYILIQAKNLEDAQAIAERCPALTHGESVELFQLT